MPHSLVALSPWLQVAVHYTSGKLAHNMQIGHLLLNAEDTGDSNDHRHRHTQYGFAGVWLGNLKKYLTVLHLVKQYSFLL